MNTWKITIRSCLAVIVIVGLMIGSVAFAKEGPKEKSNDLQKTFAYQPDRYQLLNINNLWSWAREDGQSNHSPTGDNGTFFPRGTAFLIYQDGMTFGSRAYLDEAHTQSAPYSQNIRVGGTTYGTGCREGWVEGFGAAAVPVDKDDPRARIYRIRRDWTTMSEGELKRDAAESNEIPESDVTDGQIQSIVAEYLWSWNNWPVDLGAPFIDRDGDGVYTPPPAFGANFNADSLISQGYDEPGIAGADPNSPADQVLFAIWNDLHKSTSVGRFGSEPTGLEIQMTMWGYKRTDALGNIFFRKWRFINKGGVEIDETGTNFGSFYLDSMYVCQWSDPDLGSFSDDLVGCDTTLSIGFVYNGNAIDTDFRKFNLPPPSGGYDFLQGPIVESPGDEAVFNLKKIQGYKNLGMTGFSYFSAGSPYSDPRGGYDTNTIQWYKMLRGYAPLEGPDVRYNHPPGVTPGPFPLAGDPVTQTGHIDGQGENWSFVPGDRRLLVITGPFELAPGDTQEVVVAFVAGLGADRLSSVSVMKFNDRFAQNTYDALFQVPRAPAAPSVQVAELDGEVILSWGTDQAAVNTTENVVNQPGNFKFEGYNVYQLPSRTANRGEYKRIVTYDLPTDPSVVLDEQFDQNSGQILSQPVQFGSNSGITRNFVFDRDYVLDLDQINNGQEYYLAVTSYSVATVPGFLPAQLESEAKVLTVQSKVPFGVNYTLAFGDTIAGVEHAGVSDGAAYPIVVDPTALTGHDYKVTFTDLDSNGVTEWNLEDVTAGKTLIETGTNQTGDDQYLFTDGFQLRVVGAPLSVKLFSCISNAAGPIDPPEPAAAWWYDYPVPTEYDADGYITDRQQVGAGHWMITTHRYGSSNYHSFSDFLNRSFVANGIGAVIPNDLEMRFTEAGGKIFDNWGTETLIDVPFELWNTGMDPDDTSDDYRLFAYLLDHDDNAEFNLGVGEGADHGVSGGTNDPYTDRLYWMAPTDKTPGTQGYDKLVAALAADPSLRPGWAAAPGDAPGDYDAWSIVTRFVLVNWNGGDVTTATSPDDYNQAMPETGTVFRITMTKPNGVNDVFTFTAPAGETSKALEVASAKKVGVFPNPYFAFNPLETNRLSRFVTFNNLPRVANIRIFNLAGQLVRTIAKDGDSQFLNWNLLNHSGLPVASGMYIAHIEMPDVGVTQVLKLAIIQEAEILETF